MKTPKIIIVGAGPIGCYLAQLLRRKGLDSVLIEEDKSLGEPVHCAGLLGKKVFDEPQISLSKKSIVNTINEGMLYLGGQNLLLKRKKVAYVVDREIFDKELGKGLSIHFGTKFLGLEKQKNYYLIETNQGELKADIVVGADGANSAVRGFVTNKKMNYLTGVQFRMLINPPRKNDRVSAYFRKPYFYWIIPENKDIIRVGVLSKNPYQDLLNFINKEQIKGKILKKYAGVVPLNHFFPLFKDKIFLLGDSAAQIKPFTYGGIYMGMRAAELLAGCIVEKKLKKYELLWRQKYQKEIKISLTAREVFQNLSQKELNRIFSLAKKHKKIIEKKGNFEKHSLLVKEFMKESVFSRDILTILLKIIKAGVRK